MALTRRIGLGVTLGVDTTGGNTFVALGAIVDGFNHGGAKADIADMSILSDTYKPKAKGQIDPGEVTFQVAYDPADTTTSTKLTAMLTANGNANAAANFQITYPAVGAVNASTETFLGWVSGLGRDVKKGNMIVAPVTITISGAPGFTGE